MEDCRFVIERLVLSLLDTEDYCILSDSAKKSRLLDKGVDPEIIDYCLKKHFNQYWG